jgi:ubiquitin C-terminal hydrolase
MDITLGISKFKNNDGVSCYMISILHILQQISEFTNNLLNNKPKKNTITLELFKLIKLSLSKDNINISPISFKKIITKKNNIWGDFEHQDSQEFYTFIITQLEEECGKKIMYIEDHDNITNNNLNNNNYLLNIIANKYIQDSEIKDYSYIKNLFVGYLISNTTCYFCNTNSPSFQSFITLPLSIPINKNTTNTDIFSLDECLSNFINDEKLDKYNKLKCSICFIKNRSNIKIQIWKAPKILVIHLKRFITNNYGIVTSKITNRVNYPINNFNIINYFHPDSPFKNNTYYNLIGINLHYSIGDIGSVNAGHYISIVKNNYDESWCVFNDSNDVIKINENNIEKNLQNSNAYLLYYVRLD